MAYPAPSAPPMDPNDPKTHPAPSAPPAGAYAVPLPKGAIAVPLSEKKLTKTGKNYQLRFGKLGRGRRTKKNKQSKRKTHRKRR